jgi:hypothetical protein
MGQKSNFQRRHYEAIAKILTNSDDWGYLGKINVYDKKRLVNRFISLFEEDNYNFNRTKFLNACGLDEG